MDDRDKQKPEPDGVEVVVRVLRGMKGVPEISTEQTSDIDHLADLLLDHAGALAGDRLLYYLICLLSKSFDARYPRILEREYLLLDPIQLTEEAIVAIYCRYLDGDRQRPFREWSERMMLDTALRSRTRRDLVSVATDPKSPPRDQMIAEVVHLINQATFETRRIGWYSWVEHRPVEEVARLTNRPLEQVEWVLEEWIQKALRKAGFYGAPGSTPRNEIGGDRFWKLMEEGEES